jgi:glycosyltransferase involved in cell wall biosynthesis
MSCLTSIRSSPTVASVLSKEVKSVSSKLIILDDTFPNLASGFRIAEFSYYLREYEISEAFSISAGFELVKSQYIQYYPDIAHKIQPFNTNNDFSCSLFYMVFLLNAYFFLPLIEYYQTPFVFTLYADGKYFIDDPVSDEQLQTVCSSPYLKKVIVTQKIDYDYLMQKDFLPPEKIEYIYGVVTQTDYWEKNLVPKKYYPKDKNTFDICFVAYKYIERGIDKGYDIFVETAKKLAPLSEDIRFHVVGGFTENDIDVTAIRDRIKFYSRQHQGFFPSFYSKMDLLLTPDHASKLHPGKYVFISTSMVQTALNGVALFCIDEKKINTEFQNGTDLVILPDNIDGIVETISNYFHNLEDLYKLSANGMKKFKRIYAFDNQMKRRVEILNEFL